MKTCLRCFLTLALSWLLALTSHAQTPITISDPNKGFTTCPNFAINYTLFTTNSSQNLNGCTVTWTIVGGRDALTGSTTVGGGPSISVIWDDKPTTITNGVYSSSLKAVTSGCTNPAVSSTATDDITVRSLERRDN